MAKAILMKGGSGGVTSDDVTAGKAQVLQGYRTITTDSDDEPTEGLIQVVDTSRDNYTKTRTTVFGIDLNRMTMYMHLPQGNAYYMRPDGSPHVEIVAQALGDATADKVLKNSTFTSKNGLAMQGAIENRGNVVDTAGFENAYWDSKFLARMEQGFYSQNGQYKPCVAISYAALAQAAGVDRSKMLDTLTIAGRQGQIKSINTQDNNYRANKSTAFGIDWWSDPSNVVFWIDFPHGNGYYNRPDGHPHVCIDAINLGDVTADKVMRGFTATSKNGVKFAGTMPDYSSGRVAFRNATFDNVLVSGVANTGLGNNLNVYSKPSIEIRDGIIKFYNGGSVSGGGLHQYRSNTVLEEAVTLAHSVNLTPFRTIRLGLKYPYGGRWGTVGGVGSLVGILWALPTNITPEYVPSRNAKINPNVIKRAGYKDGVIPATQGQWNTPTEIPAGAEYFVDIDVSDLQGHHRIVLGMAVSEANHREDFTIQVAVYVNNGISGISHIEFIN